MSGPIHTPYDGSAKPFSIGLKPLDPANWIEIDEHYKAHLAEKDRLIAEHAREVFAARADTDGSQREVLDLVVDHLIRGWSRIFPDRAQCDFLGERLPRFQMHGSDEPPLQIAARFVQEDLVLMRRSDDGWRLAAASLCFPSSWSLAEKFDRPLDAIHAPVPDFGPGTRTATLITRIFDNLKADQPVERMNWSLQEDAALYHPRSKSERDAKIEAAGATLLGVRPADAAFIRVERQTLRKMPVSGDILFTIRIHLDPMATLTRHPRRAELASALAGQLAALDPAQLAYKGLAADRDALVARLRAIASD
ncbi:MAG: DUF3445 domain-containing protein [Rhizobiaceae bacterium]